MSATTSDVPTSARPQTRGERLAAPVWVMWAGLLFGGMILASMDQWNNDYFLKATRLASSLLLVLAGFVFASSASRPALVVPLLALALGMLFGFLGDLSNSQLIIEDPKQATMGGILTFAIGHVFYMAACLWVRRHHRLDRPAVWWGSILVWQAIGIAGWGVVVYTDRPLTPVHWAALPYCMLLAGTAGMTTALGLMDRRYLGLALGGAFFLASDLVLAIQLFREDIDVAQTLIEWTGFRTEGGRHALEQVSRNACWLLYGPAQMLIVFASLAVQVVDRSLSRASQSA